MKGPDTMRLIVLAGMLFAAQGTNAQTIERPDNLPPGFETLIERGASRCGSEDTADFSAGGFTTPYDLNDDGINDYIVNSDYFRCYPAGHLIYGGTAGTHYSFFVSQEDGTFDEVMHLAAHNMQVVYFGEKPAFVFAHHGGSCGYSGSTGCVSAMFWSNFENKFIGKGY
ncbi:hypothetical protein [Sulfitobacter sp. 20_GPM-1509m]|uniref:hypothetical protein n=1 Tax=Sulfitobacter sp. 20_GPM-1509m TaxID=1380367 RepID=UPI0012DF594F|nr:hypothetical protein [Sulfitobacter sp. 20_GPM-1509m]